jgi:hypothetical protein
MTARVLGVGIGLFAIIAIWAVAILCCIISHRTHKNVGTGVAAVASVATLILILVPRDSEVPKKAVFKASCAFSFLACLGSHYVATPRNVGFFLRIGGI